MRAPVEHHRMLMGFGHLLVERGEFRRREVIGGSALSSKLGLNNAGEAEAQRLAREAKS